MAFSFRRMHPAARGPGVRPGATRRAPAAERRDRKAIRMPAVSAAGPWSGWIRSLSLASRGCLNDNLRLSCPLCQRCLNATSGYPGRRIEDNHKPFAGSCPSRRSREPLAARSAVGHDRLPCQPGAARQAGHHPGRGGAVGVGLVLPDVVPADGLAAVHRAGRPPLETAAASYWPVLVRVARSSSRRCLATLRENRPAMSVRPIPEA